MFVIKWSASTLLKVCAYELVCLCSHSLHWERKEKNGNERGHKVEIGWDFFSLSLFSGELSVAVEACPASWNKARKTTGEEDNNTALSLPFATAPAAQSRHYITALKCLYDIYRTENSAGLTKKKIAAAQDCVFCFTPSISLSISSSLSFSLALSFLPFLLSLFHWLKAMGVFAHN